MIIHEIALAASLTPGDKLALFIVGFIGAVAALAITRR